MSELAPYDRKNLVKLRIAETMREVGLLVLVFAPLDFLFDPRPVSQTGPVVAGALVIAFVLLTLGIRAEKRIYDAN